MFVLTVVAGPVIWVAPLEPGHHFIINIPNELLLSLPDNELFQLITNFGFFSVNLSSCVSAFDSSA